MSAKRSFEDEEVSAKRMKSDDNPKVNEQVILYVNQTTRNLNVNVLIIYRVFVVYLSSMNTLYIIRIEVSRRKKRRI